MRERRGLGLLAAVLIAVSACAAALARGLEEETIASIQFGADLYVTGTQFGRNVPLPMKETSTRLRAIPGVQDVVPRCVGPIAIGNEVHAVLVGMPPDHFPAWVDCI